MSWSLAVQNGDLSISGSQLATVSKDRKLIQDLRHHILEQMGFDKLHPGYGSLLDGGIDRDGVQHESLIAHESLQLGAILIESEIRRILADYQAQQLARARSDRYRYNKTTFTANEVLATIRNIDLQQVEDTLHVLVYLTTLGEQEIELWFAFPRPTRTTI